MNSYEDLIQVIGTIEDEDIRERVSLGVKVLVEQNEVVLRDSASCLKQLSEEFASYKVHVRKDEVRLKMLKTFKDVAVRYMNDIFARRKIMGQENNALIDIFRVNMNKEGYFLNNGEWVFEEK